METFQEKVIDLMRKIPEGKVTTYKLIAQKLGCKAYRAVGNAVGANPFAPVVPCHRVVKTDGTVGNYGGDVKKKIVLLKKEGVQINGKTRKAKIADFKKVLFIF